MTSWQKLKTGPRHAIACQACGKRVSVSQAALVAVIVPVGIGAWIASASDSLALGAAAILAGGVAAVLAYLYGVPVVRRDP